MTKSEHNGFVDSREIKGVVKLYLRSDGIVEQHWDETSVEVNGEKILLTKDLLGEMVGKKRVRIFVATQDFSGMNAEAREVAATAEANEYTMAVAVLIDSLAKKMMFNLFLTMNKPIVPIKGFTNKETGITWLKSMDHPDDKEQ